MSEPGCRHGVGASHECPTHGIDMPDLTDHDAVREWTIARGGRPAMAGTPRPTGGENVVLRLLFDQPGALLERDDDATYGMNLVEWRDWFATFDEEGLALRVGETIEGELDSRHELVSREDAA